MDYHRRKFLQVSGAAILVTIAAPLVHAAEETVHVWRGPVMGSEPFIKPAEFEQWGPSEVKIRSAIDQLSEEALRHVWKKPPEERAQLAAQIREDKQQFHDELPRLREQKQILLDRKTPIPKGCQIEEMQQGELFFAQLYAGGRMLRNVVADLRGLPENISNREFVMLGKAMRQVIPGVCKNCGFQIVENQTSAICVPIPTGPNVRTVAEGLRRA